MTEETALMCTRTSEDPERRSPDRVTRSVSRVLVVDDSVTVRKLLRKSLEAMGHDVLEATDGSECLFLCQDRPPDLVLLDVEMPTMDGLATLRELKADEKLETIPVIFLTGRTTGDDVAVGLDAGAQDYLRKPCHPAELAARVNNALRLKAAEDELAQHIRMLDEMSMTDLLTGLGNRRRFEFSTADLLAELGPDAVVALLIVDIDHFKRVNDTEGHQTGDLVLRIAAQRLANVIPKGSTLVRWGGEEFLAVIPGYSGTEVEELAEALRGAIGDSPLAIDDDHDLTVTISVGCAFGRLDDVQPTIRRADDALYRAKESGRNRVVADLDG